MGSRRAKERKLKTARDLMTPNPVSILAQASIKEAAATLVDHHFGALPVINEAGRPIGVLSQTDIVRFERERVDYEAPPSERRIASGESLAEGYQVEKTAGPAVQDLMTPFVYAVRPTATAESVVEEMVARKIHRLFVIDESGVLIGVISAFDVVRHLAG